MIDPSPRAETCSDKKGIELSIICIIIFLIKYQTRSSVVVVVVVVDLNGRTFS